MKIKLFILSLVLLSQTLTFAATFKAGQYYRLSKKDTLRSDLFYGGREVKIAGVVQSDAVLGAETVRLSGKVQDDLYASAREINIEGKIGDTFMGFAKEIRISGVVHGDVIAYAGEVFILPGARIEGKLYVGTGRLSIDEAFVASNIRGGARQIDLNGVCGGDINLSGTQISFGERFKSEKKVNITLHEEPSKPIANAPPQMELTIEKEKYFFQKGWFYYFLFSAFVVGILLIGLFPGFFDNLTALAKEKTGKTLLTGLGFFIITPIVMVILLIVLPLGILLTIGFFSIVYLSKIFVSAIAGQYLTKQITPNKTVNRFVSFTVGLVLITLISQISQVGGAFYLLAILFGGGTFIYYLFTVRKNGTSAAA